MEDLIQYMSALVLIIRVIVDKQQRVLRQRSSQEFQRKGNTSPPNGYFYCEGLYFMFTEYYTFLKDDVTN